ncbi:unnamed protein product, partial [Brachionus calyciflorus]
EIVNQFEFDKTKIVGVNCDQSSSLIRLFKQNENYYFDEELELENYEELNDFSLSSHCATNNFGQNEHQHVLLSNNYELNSNIIDIDLEIQDLIDILFFFSLTAELDVRNYLTNSNISGSISTFGFLSIDSV